MTTENGGPLPPRRTADGGVPEKIATPGAELPPHPLDRRWYTNVEGQTYGPYSGHDMKKMAGNGQIHETDFVCPEGGNAWTAAKADPILGAIFRTQQTNTQIHTQPAVSANGGTVVQVTNQIPNNNANVAALLLASGDAAPKSPGIALLISFLICGGGQMYNGQVGKGIAMLIGFAITIWIFGLGLIIYIWSLVDAYSTAKQMNLKYQQRVLAGLM